MRRGLVRVFAVQAATVAVLSIPSAGPALAVEETRTPSLTAGGTSAGVAENPLDSLEPVRLTLAHDRPYWRTNLLKRVVIDQKFLVTRWWPAEFRRPSFAAPLVFVAATGLASSGGTRGLDSSLERSVDSFVSGSGNSVAGALTSLGNGPLAMAALGSSYLIARWTHHDHFAAVASLSAEALVNAGIWSTALKRIAARTRPSGGGLGEFFVQHPAPGQEIGSFPSGHAMGSFAVAAVFSDEYRGKPWVHWVSFGLAGLIAGSRVALGRHYPSDVVVGAMLGSSLGHMVVARQEGERPSRAASGFEPIVDPLHQTYGLSYHFSW